MQIEEVIANPTKENVTDFMDTLSSNQQKLMFRGHMLREGVLTSELETLFSDIEIEED